MVLLSIKIAKRISCLLITIFLDGAVDYDFLCTILQKKEAVERYIIR
jgi:hypothetical protein